MTDEVTYDEIELIKQGVCDGCKGLFTLHETGCYMRCEPFQEELKETRDLKEDKHD
jgi:hypothetical protein